MTPILLLLRAMTNLARCGGVGRRPSPAAARAFAEEHDLTFPILFDTEGTVSRAYRLRSLPSTFTSTGAA